MPKLTAHTLALIFGIVFVVVALLGFVPNPLVSETGIFAVNTAHNLAHLVSGILLLGSVFVVRGKEEVALMLVAALYVVIAVLGFMMTGDMMLGMIHVNEADKYLHVLLAVVLSAAAYMGRTGKPA